MARLNAAVFSLFEPGSHLHCEARHQRRWRSTSGSVFEALLEDWRWRSDGSGDGGGDDGWRGQVLSSERVAEGTRCWGLDHGRGAVGLHWGGQSDRCAGNQGWGSVTLDSNWSWGSQRKWSSDVCWAVGDRADWSNWGGDWEELSG